MSHPYEMNNLLAPHTADTLNHCNSVLSLLRRAILVSDIAEFEADGIAFVLDGVMDAIRYEKERALARPFEIMNAELPGMTQ